MRSDDTKTLAYQNSQKLFTDSGYIHRNDPDDYIISEDGATARVRRKNGPPQFKYCKLSKEQMIELKNYLTPHIKCLKSTVIDLFDSTPIELITDKDGTIMTDMTFRRFYSKFKNEILTDADDIKKKVLAFKAAGFSADEIRGKLRNVMRPQYLRPILEECGFGSQKSKAQIVREMLAEGMSYAQINKKHPDIPIRYARELDALMKKGKKHESK